MEDLHGFNEAEMRASVEHMLLTPMQLRLECLCAQGATPPSNGISRSARTLLLLLS